MIFDSGENNMNDEEWIEKFYSDLESGLENYTRPADYKERAMRILNGKRYPYSVVYEGIQHETNKDWS